MNEHREKNQFEAIPIPAELGASVKSGLRKGKRRLAYRRTLSGMAAAVALVFLTANIPPLYARAAELPILAPLVRVMRVGNGGKAVSGVVAHVEAGESLIRLAFTHGNQEAPVPVFSAVQRKAPRRVILRLHGLAAETPLDLAETLRSQSAVSDAYPISTTDPEEQGVVIHLEPGWNCAAGQYEQSLELQFTLGETEPPAEYEVLCSEPLPQGMELAQLTELLLWEGATQLKAPSGDYYVVLGEFPTEQQAQQAQQNLLDTKGVHLNVVHFANGAPQS